MVRGNRRQIRDKQGGGRHKGGKKKRKGSEAWLYYILMCLPYSACEQKSGETKLYPLPGPSPCINVSSSSLAATETNESVFPADHSHPLLPVLCDGSSALKRGNRSRRKRASVV